jgi:hypothetical protein
MTREGDAAVAVAQDGRGVEIVAGRGRAGKIGGGDVTAGEGNSDDRLFAMYMTYSVMIFKANKTIRRNSKD